MKGFKFFFKYKKLVFQTRINFFLKNCILRVIIIDFFFGWRNFFKADFFENFFLFEKLAFLGKYDKLVVFSGKCNNVFLWVK